MKGLLFILSLSDFSPLISNTWRILLMPVVMALVTLVFDC